MKSKKFLAIILTALMTASSVCVPTFAENEENNTNQPLSIDNTIDTIETTETPETVETVVQFLGAAPTLESLSLSKVEADSNMVNGKSKATGILVALTNVGHVDSSMEVKLYNNNTLLATASLNSELAGQDYSELTATIICSGSANVSTSWSTTLAETDWYGKAPNKVVVNIDGAEKSFAVDTIVSYDTDYVKMEVSKKKVAEVNGKKYSLSGAVSAAKNGDTVNLTEDVHVGLNDMKEYNNTKQYTYITITRKKITINLNGHTIDLADDAKNSGAKFYQFITIAYAADVTITGNGKIDLESVNAEDAFIFYTVKYSGYDKSKLTIENGTFIGSPCVVKNKGENDILIKGGTYDITNKVKNTYACQIKGVLNSTGNDKYIQLEGGTIIGNDPRYFDDGNLVKTGYTVKRDGERYTVVPETDTKVTLTTKYKNYLSQYDSSNVQYIDEAYSCESLEEAYEKANAGETITLKKDISGDGIVINKDITLDLNGHTYNIDGETVGSSNTKTNGIQILKDNTVAIKNGTIKSEKAKHLIQNYSNLTLENVVLDGSKLIGNKPYTLSHNCGELNINNGSKIIANSNGYAFDVCEFGSYTGAKATVADGAQILGFVQMSDYNGGSFDGKLIDGTGTESVMLGDYTHTGSSFIMAERRSMEITADKASV